MSSAAVGVLLLPSACAPTPVTPQPAATASVARPPPPKPPPPSPEVVWDPATSDDTGVTIAGLLTTGADAVEAVANSVSCPTDKLGRGEIAGERASLRLEATEVATAVRCHGLRIKVTHGTLSSTTVVPFDLTVHLLPGVAGGVGISRTTSNPDAVLAVPGSSPMSKLTLAGDTYVARGVNGENVEFAVPILALTRAALRKQHAVASTGLKPIEYVLGLTVAGAALPVGE